MQKLKILICGISTSYLEISKKMLQFHFSDCQIDLAFSVKDCIESATQKLYDLILCDYDLGEVNALRVLDELRHRDINIPIVILIDEKDEDKVEIKEEDNVEYIIKVRGYLTALPFTIRNILERKHILETNRNKHFKERKTGSTLPQKGYFILDRYGRFLSADEEMEKITGYSESELSELTFYDLLAKDEEIKYYEWSKGVNRGESEPLNTQIIAKYGELRYLKLFMEAIKDDHDFVIQYKGHAEVISAKSFTYQGTNGHINPLEMAGELSRVMLACYREPLNVLLERIAEIACQTFKFNRSTIALLDKRKRAFIKQAMVGYTPMPLVDSRAIEVPNEVIERIFADKFRVKVIYYNQSSSDASHVLSSRIPERRTQKRRPDNQWHKRDLILVNLMDRYGKTFGYISLDDPSEGNVPTRETFENLEIFGQLASFAIENYYQFYSVDKVARRLKQILITSNIFKLYLSLNDILKELVWSIKFTLDFNLIAVGLISKKSGQIEIKAVACEDKVKQNHLMEVTFPLKPFAQLLRDEYNYGKTYFVNKKEPLFENFKQIYYGSELNWKPQGNWPYWGVLLVPIKSKEGKIVGFILADDPTGYKIPDDESIKLLEILANQIAIAIDNRILYVQAKRQQQVVTTNHFYYENPHNSQQNSDSGIRNLVHKIFG
ncbi:MAG: PAS domain S-box protein [Calditrichaeota bacterium]|nr:MAG: PAS domain S-box protein [Calditrichota bacterium]